MKKKLKLILKILLLWNRQFSNRETYVQNDQNLINFGLDSVDLIYHKHGIQIPNPCQDREKKLLEN